jgi:hypothetical protein
LSTLANSTNSKRLARVRRAAFTLLALAIAGCAAVGAGGSQPIPTTSVQTVEYYPFQVKGYQNTYPHRSVVVLLPTDARDLSASNAAPDPGQPPIGVVTDQSELIIQRLYSQPLANIVQGAIVRSAEEAGLSSTAANQSAYLSDTKTNADYVLASQITKCWVKKHRGPNGQFGPTWSTVADFTVKVTLYKPPFQTPFWQGTSAQSYYDPPIGSFGLGPDDEAGIYDDPGQVLSVSMTRAVAGIFQRDDLHALVLGDHMTVR